MKITDLLGLPDTSLLKIVGGDVNLRALLEPQLKSQLNELAVANMERAITKSLDGVFNVKGLSIAQKREIADQLAQNGARAFLKCAEMLLAYPEFAESVAKAKELDDAELLDKARDAREEAKNSLKKSLLNVVRGVTGRV